MNGESTSVALEPGELKLCKHKACCIPLHAQTSCNMALVFLNTDGKSSPISLSLIYSVMLISEH